MQLCRIWRAKQNERFIDDNIPLVTTQRAVEEGMTIGTFDNYLILGQNLG